jgi:proline iminopeptidase
MQSYQNADQASRGGLHPALEPYRADWLAVGGGHRIYFENSGNPAGYPVLFVHGGPGSRSRPAHRRFFDPRWYRIVLFDQRGCGQSTPAGGTLENTTAHLVADIEQLRRHLGVDRWLLFGGSWGSTLSLAYAIAHPDRVAGMVLRGVFLASDAEVAAYLSVLPQSWDVFPGMPLVEHYRELVEHAAPEVALAAARRWWDYESRVMSLEESSSASAAPPAEEMLASARVQLHFLAHHCFLRPDELLDNLPSIGPKPTIVVQGTKDLVCPPATAVAVAGRLSGAQLRLIADGGHSALQPAMAAALCAATAGMRELITSGATGSAPGP